MSLARGDRSVFPIDLTRGWLGWLAGLTILFAIGAIGFLYQVVVGLGVTNLSDGFVWGLYIVAFMVFMATAGGTLAIAGAILVFRAERFMSLVKPSLILSLASVIVAGPMVIADLGNPLRSWGFYVWTEPMSPLTGDFIVVHLFVVFPLFLLWLLSRGDLAARGSRLALRSNDTKAGRRRDKRIAQYVGGLALLSATVFYPTGWLFAVMPGREAWFDPLLGVMSVTKAILAGLALLAIVGILADRYTAFSLAERLQAQLAVAMGVMIVIHVLYFELAREFPTAWATESTMADVISTVFVSDSLLFYGWIIVGGIIPLGLLLLPQLRRRAMVVVTAGVLILIGVFLESAYILESGFPATYVPNVFEFMVMAGFIGLGALIVTIGMLLLSTVQTEERLSTGDA